MRDKLADVIHGFFGCDAAYFGVDAYELADYLIEKGLTFSRPKKTKVDPNQLTIEEVIANEGN